MSWFSKPLNKGIAIGAGVLALVVIALIILGVLFWLMRRANRATLAQT